MIKAIKMNENDIVSTVLSDVSRGDEILVIDKMSNEIEVIIAEEKIPFGNKIALGSIEEGGEVYKYGYPIGISRCAIAKGDLVHVHNVKSAKVDLPKITATEVLKIMGVEKHVAWGKSHE